MKLQFRKATIDDIPFLIDDRLAFLHEVGGPRPANQTAIIKANLEKYFAANIASGDYVCFIVQLEGKVVATGGMVIRNQPANYGCPTGRVGYIMNMFTAPEHRRKGISSALLEKLAETARELNLSILELHATTIGEPVYKKFGFIEPKSKVLELRM
jgi:GNAT superfamily N-acetyltransferase